MKLLSQLLLLFVSTAGFSYSNPSFAKNVDLSYLTLEAPESWTGPQVNDKEFDALFAITSTDDKINGLVIMSHVKGVPSLKQKKRDILLKRLASKKGLSDKIKLIADGPFKVSNQLGHYAEVMTQSGDNQQSHYAIILTTKEQTIFIIYSADSLVFQRNKQEILAVLHQVRIK